MPTCRQVRAFARVATVTYFCRWTVERKRLAPEDERDVVVHFNGYLISVPRAFERVIVVGFGSRGEVNDVGLIKRERA